MRLIQVLILLCILSLGLFAQQGATLTGQITSCGNPEANISVQITDVPNARINVTVETDGEGRYKFDNIAAGRYFVRVVGKTGGASYYFFNKDPLVLSGGATREENIVVPRDCGSHIWLALPDIPQVFISAGTAQTIDKVSKTVDVIDGQEMRDRADFALVESLRTIPGFRVAQSGGFGRVASIKTRGLRNQDTAVLIDGVRLRDPSAIAGDVTSLLSDLTLTSVSKVEVLRGSGSSLYGTNAVGGVIDLQTPSARTGTHGQIGGAFGGLGLGRFRGNLSHGTSGGKIGIGGGLSRTVYTKGIDGNDEAHNTNVQTRFDYLPFAATAFSGKVFFSDADVRLNSNPDTTGTLPPSNATIIEAAPNSSFLPDINDPDSIQRTRFFTGQVSGVHAFSSNFILRGFYNGLSTDRENENGILGPGFQSASTSLFDGRIDTGNARLSWTTAKNTLTAGYEFERERFGNEGKTPMGTGDFFTTASQRSNTFFAQNLLNLADGRLQIAGGTRIQQFRLERPEFSLTNAPYTGLNLDSPPVAYTFDGAVSYFFRRSGTKLRAHIGNGYRVPSLYERFGTFFSTFGAPSFIAIGDPFLKPERTIAADIGVEQNLATDRVRLSATYFYTRLTDIIGYGNAVPTVSSTVRPFGGYENQRGGVARGGEFSVKGKASDTTDIFVSYTYANSDQRTPQVSGSGIIKTLGVPEHQFTVVATQRFKRFWVNFDFLATSTYLAPIFSGTTFSTYIYRFKGNRRGDLTGGYTFGFRGDKLTLRLFATAENVFNQEYFENGFRTANANGRFGFSFGF